MGIDDKDSPFDCCNNCSAGGVACWVTQADFQLQNIPASISTIVLADHSNKLLCTEMEYGVVMNLCRIAARTNFVRVCIRVNKSRLMGKSGGWVAPLSQLRKGQPLVSW